MIVACRENQSPRLLFPGSELQIRTGSMLVRGNAHNPNQSTTWTSSSHNCCSVVNEDCAWERSIHGSRRQCCSMRGLTMAPLFPPAPHRCVEACQCAVDLRFSMSSRCALHHDWPPRPLSSDTMSAILVLSVCFSPSHKTLFTVIHSHDADHLAHLGYEHEAGLIHCLVEL